MIPKIFHHTSKSTDITWEERKMVARVQRMLPDWTAMFHDDAGLERLVVQIFPQHLETYRAMPLGVARSDIGRLLMIYVHGGFYFDTDYKLFRPIPADLMRAACVLPPEVGDLTTPFDDDPKRLKFRLGNAVLGSQPGYPLWRDFILHVFETVEIAGINEMTVVPITGPIALTDFYLDHRAAYPEAVVPKSTAFFPKLRYASAKVDDGDTAVGVHLMWSSWRNYALDMRIKTFLRRKFAGLLCYTQDSLAGEAIPSS